MKIEVLSRSETAYTRSRRDDRLTVHHALKPELHPFEKEREHVRALRAAKMSRMFAKPFVGALEGHKDGIFCMATSPQSLETLVSGACDGEIRVWDVSARTAAWTVERAHDGFVRGVAVCCEGETFISCGDDKVVKLWSVSRSYVPPTSSRRRGRRLSSSNSDDDDHDDDHDEEEEEDLAAEETDEDDEEGGRSLGSRLKRIHPGKGTYKDRIAEEEESDEESKVRPLSTYLSGEILRGCDCDWANDESFVTCGDTVALWDKTRSEPLHRFKWPVNEESVVAVKFNPAERGMLASVGGADRSVVLYDARDANPIRRVVQSMRNNQLAWNPLEPFHFTTANEDYNLYTFDMRRLDKAMMVHKDHVGAVLDVAYSPTGREFVSGSYDRSIRIFPVRGNGRSREVYTAPRMQRVFAVRFSGDARFVLSGSEDFNVRVWKAHASRPVGVISARQRRQLDYSNSVLKRYAHLDEIRKIFKTRRLPKRIYKARLAAHEQEEKARTKRQRTIAHSSQDAVEYVPLRKRTILKEEE